MNQATTSLFAKSVNLPLPADFKITDALTANGMAFIRDGAGMVTRGEVLRLVASGPGRIAALEQQWRELCSAAQTSDTSSNNGRGLIAFGSIAFDDQSAAESLLVVPSEILGVRDGRAWLTKISTTDFNLEPIVDTSWTSDWLDPWGKQPAINLTAGELDESGFEIAVQRALGHLSDQNGASSDLEKVVLARDIVGEIPPGWDPRQALSRFAGRYPSCWTYWVNNRFGASPELLVRVDHGRFSARVLAGTAGRGTDPDVDRAIAGALTASPKNKVEHRLAVESLINALEPYCDEIVSDAQPFSLALPNVWHLASDVQGIISRDSSVLDLAEALHPTAAVAGTPRLEALELIRQLEPSDRGGYAGPIGWVDSHGDGEWVIGLRGAAIVGDKIVAHAGCGIVLGSNPAAELAETELKFQPIRHALG
jgi:menaquinone-specific isochorismate synthase